MKKKTIWIWNHYATNMFFDKAGRHHWFGKNLIEKGYNVKIFCASTNHNNGDAVDTHGKPYVADCSEGVEYVFVNVPPYTGNGKSRVENMVAFYRRVKSVGKTIAEKDGKPDVILASSVHPLTMIAGEKLAKNLGIPCICEVRDLWPEAIFQFGKANEKSVLGKALIKGEHLIYKKADALIFTKEGDTDYLKEKRWTTAQGGDIDLDKCHYINNGVDIAVCEERSEKIRLEDADLNDETKFNVIYVGAVRPVNNVGNILDAAAILKGNGEYKDVQFLIYGDGIQLTELKKRVKTEGLDNVKIKGYVSRQYVPYVLSRSAVNLLNYSQSQYNWARGNSSNKLFEYMASGKPVISNVQMGYSIIQKYACGVELEENTPQALAEEIVRFHDMSAEDRDRIGKNARAGAGDFDFSVLTDKLIEVIESVI